MCCLGWGGGVREPNSSLDGVFHHLTKSSRARERGAVGDPSERAYERAVFLQWQSPTPAKQNADLAARRMFNSILTAKRRRRGLYPPPGAFLLFYAKKGGTIRGHPK